MDDFKKYLQSNRDALDTDEPREELWSGVKDTLHPPKRIRVFWKQLAAACMAAVVGAGIYLYIKPRSGVVAAPPVIAKEEQAKKISIDSITGRSQDAQQIKDRITLIPAQTEKKSTAKATPKKKLSVSSAAESNTSHRVLTQSKSLQNIDTLYGFETIEASYASMLDIQLEKLRTQPIYAESPEYFSFFKNEFRDLEKDEAKLKQLLIVSEDKTERLDELMLIYQRKISLLKQLQFEINKVNNKVKQTNAGIQTQKPSYINL